MLPEVTRLFAYDEMYLDVFQNDEFTIKRFNGVKIARSLQSSVEKMSDNPRESARSRKHQTKVIP